MARVTTPNYVGLTQFLAGKGIESSRVSTVALDASGYDYWPDRNEGSGMRITGGDGGMRLQINQVERKEWDSAETWLVVQRLMSGEALEDIFPPIKVAPKAPAPTVQKAPAKPKAGTN